MTACGNSQDLGKARIGAANKSSAGGNCDADIEPLEHFPGGVVRQRPSHPARLLCNASAALRTELAISDD